MMPSTDCWNHRPNGTMTAHRRGRRKKCRRYGQVLAEEEGFEPPDGCPSAVFKTAALSHSATPPGANGVGSEDSPPAIRVTLELYMIMVYASTPLVNLWSDGRVAEGTGLLNLQGANAPSRVRIPLAPPPSLHRRLVPRKAPQALGGVVPNMPVDTGLRQTRASTIARCQAQ